VTEWECVIELLSDCVIEWVSVSSLINVNASDCVIELVSVLLSVSVSVSV